MLLARFLAANIHRCVQPGGGYIVLSVDAPRAVVEDGNVPVIVVDDDGEDPEPLGGGGHLDAPPAVPLPHAQLRGLVSRIIRPPSIITTVLEAMSEQHVALVVYFFRP